MSSPSSYDKLLNVSGDSISSGSLEAGGAPQLLSKFGERGRELLALLESRNGFFAFECCLLVRPVGIGLLPRGIVEWNAPGLWLADYSLDSRSLFFAEDVFGNQFAIRDDAIQKFDAETGEFEDFVTTVPEWADTVLSDYKYETGYPVGHAWQEQHGPIPSGHRLCPRIPFVCGGELRIENLVSVDEVKGMLFRANLARQIRDVPDGSQVQFEILE